ncbi:MAG TPA: VWA domain-containing protein [Acidimicrobiales bacterium]|nr:VWA domain-containing protein [Acidimicrobiales bacterium]
MAEPSFPFSAVVGHDDVKLALLLNAIDPAIGGVLLRGQKGSAKSTLARGLARLLAKDAPFVELPVGATEDRLVGTVDMAAALTTGERRFQPGLLAEAHGGVLYVDEVNLLPDHLVDVLLDVAAGGVNRVEREGVSHEHPSRFVLIGSMNPEEGELRPQLLDRFGLAVDVASSTDPDERAEAVARRLDFDRNPIAFLERWSGSDVALRGRLAEAGRAELPAELVRVVSALCASAGAEGLRADLVICRAAAARAGWQGRPEATVDDVRQVAPLALAHRRRRSPFEDPGIDQAEVDEALAEAMGEAAPPGETASGETASGAGQPPPPAAPDGPSRIVRIEGTRAARSEAGGRRTTTEGRRGRLVGDRPVPADQPGPSAGIALGATARAAVVRQAVEGGPALHADDLREAVREQRAGSLVVLAVDASGSMGAARRMEAAKGAVLSVLLDAYQRRDRVALITFRGHTAEVVLRPTGSVEVAKTRLTDLPTGGTTPLAAGIDAAVALADRHRGAAHQPLLVLVSDGRATAGPPGVDPVAAALSSAAAVRRRGMAAVVIDAEDGPTRLGLAAQVAEAMGARCLTVPELSAGSLSGAIAGAIRTAAPGSGPSTR